MVGSRLTVSPKADTDLAGIGAFIAERDGTARADAVVKRIQRTMLNLAFMPGMGRHRSYLEQGARAFSAAPWVIVYELKPDGDGIAVLRVVDGRRDLLKLFAEKKP